MRQSVKVVDERRPSYVQTPREVEHLVRDKGGLLACRVADKQACTAYLLSEVGQGQLGGRYVWVDVHRTMRKGSSLSKKVHGNMREAIHNAVHFGFEVRWFVDASHLFEEWPDVSKFAKHC